MHNWLLLKMYRFAFFGSCTTNGASGYGNGTLGVKYAAKCDATALPQHSTILESWLELCNSDTDGSRDYLEKCSLNLKTLA